MEEDVYRQMGLRKAHLLFVLRIILKAGSHELSRETLCPDPKAKGLAVHELAVPVVKAAGQAASTIGMAAIILESRASWILLIGWSSGGGRVLGHGSYSYPKDTNMKCPCLIRTVQEFYLSSLLAIYL